MHHYAYLSVLIFCVGFLGLCLRQRTLISVLISFELLLLASTMNFIGGSAFFGSIQGHVATLLVLVVSAAEFAVGLALIVVYFKQKKNLFIEHLNVLHEKTE